MMSLRKTAALAFALVLGAGQMAMAAEDRALPLDGVQNTRDLGGLQTTDGRSLRKGQLFRSGEIDHISEGGMSRLDAAGVTSIVDLRTTKEATLAPAEWPEGQGPKRYNFPLMEQESAMIDEMRESITSGTADAAEMDAMFEGAFSYIPTDYTTEIRSLFDVLLAQPEGEAVLYHCSGGKDRTGVATALVLSALGVSREDIMSDFMMSNTLKDADGTAAAIADQVNAEKGTSMTAEDVWPSVGVRPRYLETFYDSVADSHGSVDAYLRDGLGLTDSDIDALRARYLE